MNITLHVLRYENDKTAEVHLAPTLAFTLCYHRSLILQQDPTPRPKDTHTGFLADLCQENELLIVFSVSAEGYLCP